jgi:hypothetical protein
VRCASSASALARANIAKLEKNAAREKNLLRAICSPLIIIVISFISALIHVSAIKILYRARNYSLARNDLNIFLRLRSIEKSFSSSLFRLDETSHNLVESHA